MSADSYAREFDKQPTIDPSEVAISIRGVSKSFRIYSDRKTNVKELFTDRRRKNKAEEFHALSDITFDIPRGKTFGLIGHNGSGKSTLLKLIAGIHRPTAGSIESTGRISAMLELGAGFHPELSGRENIYLNGSILGLSRKQINESIEQIIDFSGLREFIDTPVKVYSSGMYVRLGFAIAVNLDPEILVIDEVIAVGDEEFQRKCFEHLYELRRRGVTIILVSHSLGLMAELCDQVAWIDHGHLRGVGPARELTDAYLASVNRKEAEDATEASGQNDDALADSSRRGSREVQVLGVDILSSTGGKVPFATTGTRTTLRVRYEAAEEIPQAAFGVSIDLDSGTHICDVNSGHARGGDPLAAGPGHIDFVIEHFPLLPGIYDITTVVSHQAHMYDVRERAFALKVRSDDSTLGSGVARLVGRWDLPDRS